MFNVGDYQVYWYSTNTSLVTLISKKLLFGWPNQEEWDWSSMWQVWGRSGGESEGKRPLGRQKRRWDYNIKMHILVHIFFYWRYNPLWVCILQPSSGAIASLRTRFLDHAQQRATVGRTSLDEWPIRRRGLYLTKHNTHNRQTSMPPVVFEPTIAAGERP